MTIDEWLKADRPWNIILHGDCMELMQHLEDKSINLACVDPPYGIKKDGQKESIHGKKSDRKLHEKKEWDNSIPDKKYFDELNRISINQIIWGANYFCEYLKNGFKGWIIWDKLQRDLTMSDCEIAFSSFNKPTRVFELNRCIFLKPDETTIHPTQKPVALYRWLLQHYAKPGDKIIDTHSGSGSCAIACHLEKHDFLAIEKDIDYWKVSVERYETEISQGKLF